jgi:hypothetical protein
VLFQHGKENFMTIKERLRLAIAAKTRDRTRYVQLKELTGISGDIWKNFWFDRREPDAIMIEAVSRAWPEYAYWLSTGSTNVTGGHVCPESAFCYEPGAVPLITSDAFLRAGVEAAAAVDSALGKSPELANEIATVIHGFLRGDLVHQIPSNASGTVDEAFKKIREFNQIGKIRNKEAEMQSQA